MLLKIIIALIGGILMGLTPSPINAWFLAWVALVPLWILIVKNEGVSSKLWFLNSIFLIGLVWGIGYHGLALFWITGIHPMTWLGVPWLASLAIAIFCLTFITLLGGLLVGIWATVFHKVNNWKSQEKTSLIASLIRVLIGTALWCGLEAFWAGGSLWWTSLSYTQSPHNLAILQLGQFSGPSTVTAAIVAVNGLLAEAWLKIEKQQKWSLFGGAIALCLLLHLIGFTLYNRPLERDANAAIKVGIIQGNIPNEIKFDSQGWRKAIANYTRGYEQLADAGVDAVLIPETALPFIWTRAENREYLDFYRAILERGVVAWVGGFGEKENGLTNSLFAIDRSGEIVGRYDKSKLVPLGEFIPFKEVLGKLINRLSPLDASLVHGEKKQIVETPFGRAIVGICYDSAFAEIFRSQAASGGEFMLTASNNAHYSATMPAQHEAQDVMRAIETDRWAVRATNTGYSGVVDPRGRIGWRSRLNTYQLHAETIYRRTTETLYVKWGDWLMPVLLVLGALAKVVKSIERS
ncbi:MAG: apolipoprotein N-acyltransferase [Cyanobacteriota bacterium]|nr:apolipoprotein N-acyltransferase [Cyanobacteriota bacterium]